jgi:NAD(P)-dependent dehydrogenase (short-subunit alcohol dehydrogenase family)
MHSFIASRYKENKRGNRMPGLVEGKVVVVTGGGRGIGEGIAELMAQSGAKVVVNDIGTSLGGEGTDASVAQAVVDKIRAAGGTAVADQSNIAETAGASALVDYAVKAFGRIDAVVNNAGIVRDRFFHTMSKEEWDAVIAVNLTGAFLVSRAAAAYFRKQESGAFVHLTSTAGLIGSSAQANYAATKMGIVGLSKTIALDMKRFNVRSNCVSPFAFSRMVAAISEDTPNYEARVGKMKVATPDKIAPLVVYLASDGAADVTGQIFGVRRNEIYLFSQPRPIRSVHRAEGWTPEDVASHAIPALRPSFYPLDMTADVITWDPI